MVPHTSIFPHFLVFPLRSNTLLADARGPLPAAAAAAAGIIVGDDDVRRVLVDATRFMVYFFSSFLVDIFHFHIGRQIIFPFRFPFIFKL